MHKQAPAVLRPAPIADADRVDYYVLLHSMIRMLHQSTLSGRSLLLSLVWICCCFDVVVVVAQSEVERSLGSLQMFMESAAPVVQTNPLLRRILVETVDFLDEAFYEALLEEGDKSFQKVSCSIVTYQTESVLLGSPDAQGNTPIQYYTATITLTGQATFRADTSITQQELNALTVAAFDNEQQQRFTERLLAARDLSFLKNLQNATVTVDAHNPLLDDDMTSYPPPPPGTETQQKENDDDNNSDSAPLAVWQIAVIAGAGAFGLVLCLALAFICCMNVDDEMLNHRHNQDGTTRDGSKAKLTVNTRSTSADDRNNNNAGDCELSSHSPSPARSITSQDSSVFTYNPRSVRTTMTGTGSFGGTYFTNNTGLEMDLAAWQSSTQLAAHSNNHSSNNSSNAAQHASFGDLSAIEPRNKKDLSLIQEESSAAGSAASTPSRDTNNSSSSRDKKYQITESALNDLANRERGMTPLRKGNGSGGDDSEEEDSTIFVLQSGSGSDAIMHSYNNNHHHYNSKYNKNNNNNDHGSSRPGSRGSHSSGSGSHNDNIRGGGGERLSLAGGNHIMDELQELSHQIDAYRTQQY